MALRMVSIVMLVLLSSCDGSEIEYGESEYEGKVFVSTERFRIFKWEITDDRAYSILSNHIENPYYVCLADAESKFYADDCEKDRKLEMIITEYPPNTKMVFSEISVTTRRTGAGNYLTGDMAVRSHKVFIGSETLWLDDYRIDLIEDQLK